MKIVYPLLGTISIVRCISLTDCCSDRTDFCVQFVCATLGIDLYFSKNSHMVFRIVAHSNLPQHQDFGHFHRCGFTLAPESSVENGSLEDCLSVASCQAVRNSMLSSFYCNDGSEPAELGDDIQVSAGSPDYASLSPLTS